MRETLAYSIDVSTPVSFSRTGKSEILTEDWMHPSSKLMDFELILVTKNTLYIQHEGTRHTVTAGEYLLLRPQRPSDTETLSNIRKGFQKSECSFYWLHFRCSHAVPRNALIPDLINDGYDNILLPVQGRLQHPDRALLLLIQLQDSIKNGYSVYYLNLLSTLVLSEIANQHALQFSRNQASGRSGSEKIYNDICDYIAYHIRRHLTISDIAAHFHYNEKYLTRLFKNYSGYGLKEYILRQKIENANFLLLDTNLSVKEIAQHLGFQSYRTFEISYKKYCSHTPTEYRNLFANRITNYE